VDDAVNENPMTLKTVKQNTVTLQAIADEIGVSAMTVSRVLNGDYKVHTKMALRRADEIRKVAKDMGYVPNAAARMMRSRQTRQIGLLLRNEEGHRYHNLAAFILMLGINARLEKEGYLLSVVRLGDIRQSDDSRSRVFDERLLDGLIVFGNFASEVHDWIDHAMPNCIWADTNKFDKHCCLQRNEEQVGQLVAKHLLNLGYQRVFWTGRPSYHEFGDHYSLTQRHRGLKQTLKDHGVELEYVEAPKRPDNRLCFPYMYDNLTPDCALVAYNTLGAHALAASANGMGKVVGHDFGLVCCDDTSEIFESWPGLSRASYDRFEMGYKAADMMLHRLRFPSSKPESCRIDSQWLAGNSAWGPLDKRIGR
jgi:DNA-binding LacI/PurR family transcriptional regulator